MGAVLGIDLRQMDTATENSFHITLLMGQCLGLVHVGANARKTLEIEIDIFGCFTPANAELVC